MKLLIAPFAVVLSLLPNGSAPARAAVDPASAKLAAALESIREQHLKADVFFIASDELAGRDTPSEGLKIAARFLRSRLERLGWQPGAENGYFHLWDLESTGLDIANCKLELARGEQRLGLQLGKDYWLGRGAPRQQTPIEGGLVFGGEIGRAHV